jgi:MFS superfamily sulfate permease-like transporter
MLGSVPECGRSRSYRREWLAKDVVAGIVLTTLLVPQGMAHAELAGLPPITGLYTSILCPFGYACSARRGSWCWARIPRLGR